MDKEALKKAMLQAQSMQHDLIKAQDELAKMEIEGHSNDHKVKITMSAQGDFHKVKIDPTTLVEGMPCVEKAVLEALNDVTHKAAELTKNKIANISKQIGL
jgi:DNA-binding YbaB/EbfC family protein